MQARCQCGRVSFPIPHSRPIILVICHCNKCKMTTGSAFHISAVFPYFPLPPSVEANLSTCSLGSDSGTTIDGHFCKGCGNRIVSTRGGGGEDYVSVSAPRIVGFDWSMTRDAKLATHWWTSQAVVPVPEGFTAWEGQATDEQVIAHLKDAGLWEVDQVGGL